MKDILEKVILRLKSEKGGYCRIKHKRGWLEYLKDGDLIFAPDELHRTLRRVIDTKENRPRGDKLLFLRNTRNTNPQYTAREDGTPYRPEEALERFIIVSNSDNFYYQVPIGGRKESVDIGIKESKSKFIFVELKPWDSANSPLYAIVESLKNLIEYRIILDRKIATNNTFDEVELLILAPKEYYEVYNLIDNTGEHRAEKISIVRETLNKLSSEFQVRISLMALQLDKDSFFRSCKRLYQNKKLSGQKKVSVLGADPIPVLAKDKWKLVVDSA